MSRPGRRRKLALVQALLMMITGISLTAVSPAWAIDCPGANWSADYYANQTLTGNPALARCDASINFAWGAVSPGTNVPADKFSVRWTRTATFTAGSYTFSATADDGIRVKVDGIVILDGWKDQGATTYTATAAVTAGNHVIVVEYYDNTYDAVAQFSYAAAGNLVSNGSLTAGAPMPTCFMDGSWGTSTRAGAISTDMPAGLTGRSYALTVSNYSSGDAKIMPSADPGCAPTVAASKTYTLGVYYKSTAAANAVVVFTQNAGGGWDYWKTLATLPASAAWSQQGLTVTGLPVGTTRISFAVAAVGAGRLTTTGYSLIDTSGAAPGLEVTGRWSVSTEALPDRTIHSTLLRDGRLLLIAGSGNDANNFAAGTFTTKVWNPTTNVMTDVPTPEDMFCSGHVTLADGRILIQGGTAAFPGVDGEETFTGLHSSYLFDPATNAYTKLNDAQDGHWYPTLTKLGVGDVWMAGGLGATTNSVSVKTEIFDYSELRWQAYGEMTQSWQYWGEYPHMFLMQDGRLFYTGAHTFGNQRTGTGASIYDIDTGTVGDVPGLTDKDLRDHAGSVLLPPAQSQKVLVAGGGHIDIGAAPTNSTAIVNLAAASPTYTAGPPMPGPGRQYVNLTTLFDRTVLASNGATGNRSNDIYAASIYDPTANTWATNTPADPVGRDYHSTAMLMPDGRVLVMGSNPIDGSFETRISVYEPPYLFKGARPTITTTPTAAVYGSTVALGVTGTVVSASLTAPGSNTHQMDSNARLVDLPLTGSGNTRTAAVPANPNLLPPGPYMLTVVDASGVPSVAKWITIGAVGTPAVAAAAKTMGIASSALTAPAGTASSSDGSASAGSKGAFDTLRQAAARQNLGNITGGATATAVNAGRQQQATGVTMRATTQEQGLAAADEVVTASAYSAGCTVGYGTAGSCLPVVSPGSASMGGMFMPWTCAEVRSVLPKGIALTTPGVDPQHLDTNKDGTACGRGD